jgi:hypothetical protein
VRLWFFIQTYRLRERERVREREREIERVVREIERKRERERVVRVGDGKEWWERKRKEGKRVRNVEE